MAKGVNKVIIVGNLGKDPEVKYSSSGKAVTNFSVATSESWKDKQSGQQQEKTEWHRIVMFDRLGEIAGEYLRKGSKVYIEGKLQTRKWQDSTTGKDMYATEIIGKEMQMLDSRGGQPVQQAGSQQKALQEGAVNKMTSSMEGSNAPPPGIEAVQDDDIPF